MASTLIDDVFSSPEFAFTSAAQTSWKDTSLDGLGSAFPTMAGGDTHSPTDFAFAAPPLPDHAKDSAKEPFNHASNGQVSVVTSPHGTFAFNGAYPNYGSFSASSFSSASGSATGSSFSTTDALPAISRHFARPSSTEVRRPATAGGALQSRGSPFFGYMPQSMSQTHSTQATGSAIGHPETIDETAETMFTTQNPFSASPSRSEESRDTPQPEAMQGSVDPLGPPVQTTQSWAAQHAAQQVHGGMPMGSAPPGAGNYAMMHQQNAMQGVNRQMLGAGARPQTSDGLPTFSMSGQVSLPSARTIVNQIPGSHFSPAAYPGRAQSVSAQGSESITNFPGNRAYSMTSLEMKDGSRDFMNPAPVGKAVLDRESPNQPWQFVPLNGPAPKKRPRRRYDEIERLYKCGWNGCEKSYGTLNHLNAHVAMQKHGEKRLPTGQSLESARFSVLIKSEFKDMRKAWRKSKREQQQHNSVHAYGQASAGWPDHRNSIASNSSLESDYQRRESMMSQSSSIYPSGASSYGGYESRPGTSGSMVSVASDGRPYAPFSGYQQSMQPNMNSLRRASAPTHVGGMSGYRADGDGLTPMGAEAYGNAPPHFRQPTLPFQTLTTPANVPGPHFAPPGQYGQR